MKHKDLANPHTWLLRAKANLTLAEKGGRLKGVAYAVQSRYPSVAEDITKDEYRDALKLASKVVFWAEKVIK